MLKSIRILLVVATSFDYKNWYMDVKTTFLNGNLEEDIYMQQLEGFIAKGHEHLVCKFQRSIYGLKQASKTWNIRFVKPSLYTVLRKVLMNIVFTKGSKVQK